MQIILILLLMIQGTDPEVREGGLFSIPEMTSSYRVHFIINIHTSLLSLFSSNQLTSRGRWISRITSYMNVHCQSINCMYHFIDQGVYC